MRIPKPWKQLSNRLNLNPPPPKEKNVSRIRDVYPGSRIQNPGTEFFRSDPGSRVDKIPDPDQKN
jgi:hypothetical protein